MYENSLEGIHDEIHIKEYRTAKQSFTFLPASFSNFQIFELFPNETALDRRDDVMTCDVIEITGEATKEILWWTIFYGS